MNPDGTQQSSVENQALQKLEEDLKSVEHSSATPTVANSVTNNPPVNFPNPNVPNKKSSSLMLLAVLLVAAALLATLGYVLFMQFVGGKNILSITPKACTTEAKICPDGTNVGRSGPNCEFTACPVATIVPDPTSGWKAYTNSEFGISFKLPQTWSDFITSGGEYFSKDSNTKVNLRLSKGIVNTSDAYSLAFSKTVGEHVVSGNNIKLADETFDGHPAVLMSMDNLQNTQEVPSYSYTYVIKNGTSLYIFNFWQDETMGQDIKTKIINNKPNFDQILSTLKFIEASPTVVPTGY